MRKHLATALALSLSLPLSFAASGCSLLVAAGLGAERGRSDVVVRTSSDGIVFLERKPSTPRGTSPREVVLLVHGFGGSKDHWTRFAAHLPHDVWVLAPDLPGFGESPKDEAASYDLASQVARVRGFLDEQGVDRFHVVGNSMGGHLATLLALEMPARVRSVVLFNPAGMRGPVPSAMDKLTDNGRVPFVIQTAEDFRTLLAHSFMISPRIPELLLDHFAEEAARSYAFSKKIKDDLAAKPAPIVDRIASLAPPTLVVWGDKDGVLDPSAVPLWRARVPGGLVVVMRETGHGPQIERPEEACQLVLTWWKRNAAATLKVAAHPPMEEAWTASTSSRPTPATATPR